MRVLALLCTVVSLSLPLRTVGTSSSFRIKASETAAKVPPEFLGFGEEMDRVLDMIDLGTLEDANVRFLASKLAPFYLRVGGITADWVEYTNLTEAARGQLGGYWPNNTRAFEFSYFERLCNFADATGAKLVFDLNELYGRNCHFNGTVKCIGDWDTSNMKSFLQTIKAKGIANVCPSLVGFELGNELTNNNNHLDIETNIQDNLVFAKIVREVWPDEAGRPLLFGPSTDTCTEEQVPEFISKTRGQLDGFTYHSYPNRDNSKPADLTDPSWLRQNIVKQDMHANSSACISAWRANGKDAGMRLWLTETDSSYATVVKGQPEVLSSFLNGFWYLASLGQYAATDAVEMHGRWCMLSFNEFGTIQFPAKWDPPSKQTEVSTDYYLATLYKRVVGEKVLSVTPDNDNQTTLAYAHCMGGENIVSGGVTVLVLNTASEAASVSFEGIAATTPREEYLFTPNGGDLQASTMSLNGGGSLTQTPNNESFPTLDPRRVSVGGVSAVQMPPHSYGFIVFPEARATGCA